MLCIIHLIYTMNLLLYTEATTFPIGQDDEFFTAASDMQLLLKVEQKIGHGLMRYIEKEGRKLTELERHLNYIEVEHQTHSKDNLWVSQITNAYGILKRFTKFWPSFDNYAKDDKVQWIRDSLRSDIKSLDGAFPSEKDLRGALSAITRIQNTYNITASELINGLGSYTHKLDVQELFQMGYLWSELEDFTHAREWFLEAVQRFPPEMKYVGFLDKASLYEYLAWSEYKLFNLKDAIKHTKYILKIRPGHRAALTNLEIFHTYVRKLKEEEQMRLEGKILEPVHVENDLNKKKNLSWEIGKHNLLCRGLLQMKRSVADKLYCRYGKEKAQFILKPLKIEYLYDDPNITLFHDLLNEFEINYIKMRASPYLSRATVHDIKTGKLAYADYRISKSSWIKPEVDAVVAKIFKKISHVTGLDTRSFEPLQIANYGLAGQYEPHFDHAVVKMPKRFNMYGGNRLATMLIYMSEVERGGKTVFTKTGPGVSISPRKGTGAFWYNLKRNGQSNNKTEHAACPVVLGQKWVSNIWIHEHHQEFHRKCTLNKDE